MLKHLMLITNINDLCVYRIVLCRVVPCCESDANVCARPLSAVLLLSRCRYKPALVVVYPFLCSVRCNAGHLETFLTRLIESSLTMCKSRGWLDKGQPIRQESIAGLNPVGDSISVYLEKVTAILSWLSSQVDIDCFSG